MEVQLKVQKFEFKQIKLMLQCNVIIMGKQKKSDIPVHVLSLWRVCIILRIKPKLNLYIL